MICDTCKMNRLCDELERINKVPKHENCRCFTPVKLKTNADRIRSMTDEELAHLLHSAEEHLFTGNLWNYEKWTGWLKQETGEDK